MKLGDYAVKYGIVAALKAVNDKENEMAADLMKALAYQNHVIKTEGVMPFDDRPEETQRFLKVANQIINNVDNFLFEARKVEVDPPPLEVLEEIVVDLDYQIITSASLEDAEPIILMEEKIVNEIMEIQAVIADCLAEEE